MGMSTYIHRHGFLCATPQVQLGVGFQQSLGAGIFGGDGFRLQQVAAIGTAWIELSGEVVTRTFAPGETLRVHPGHVGAFQTSVSFQIARIPGISNMIFGGDGIFLAALTGPGRVWLQSLPISKLGARAAGISAQLGRRSAPNPGVVGRDCGVDSGRDEVFRTANITFIHLHATGKQIASRPDHSATQPVQHRPGSFIPLEAENALQPQGAGAVLLRGHPPHGLKPKLKRNMGVLKYGSRRHGDLMPALMAAQQRCSHRRALSAPTARTAKTLRPTKLTQILAAIPIAAKARVELLQVTRVVFHHHAYYRW
jgi:hypothetical protein